MENDVENLNANRANSEKDQPDETIPLITIEPKSEPNAPLAKLDNFEEMDDRPTVSSTQPGVEDGFFEKPSILVNGSDVVDGLNRFEPGRPVFHGLMDTETIPDVNIYQHKKTVAQGMMDLALFSANANQLRYVLESPNHPYFYPGVSLIAISLIFQVLVGIGLILNTRYNVKDKKEICLANKINNFTVVGIFLVTTINVFISGFGVATSAPTSDTTSANVTNANP